MGFIMRVIAVESKKQMRMFTELPKKLMRDYAHYVPPIWMDEKNAYTGKNNPILKNAAFTLLLLLDELGKPIGRCIAYVDLNHNRFYGEKTGFFGAFLCIDGEKAGQLLVLAAEEWLLAQGMTHIRGPINPVAEEWGFVLEGYESDPVYMSPWNPPYYHRFFTEAGYEKVKDLLVYEADIASGYRLPARYEDFITRYQRRYPNIHIRRLNLKKIKQDAKAIWEISNIALADNWGYVPLELPVMEDMLKKLRLVVDPDAVWIVEDRGTPVGFCLGFPDINIVLKEIEGKLLPFGWIKLLQAKKKLRDYRLFGLAVHPDWHGKGLDALMYINLYQHLREKEVRMEANYILEDNNHIKNALEKLGMIKIKTYRIYEKQL
ncbi:MAG: GNAT family N-acetyltransferase [Eubacteriales bacterium]